MDGITEINLGATAATAFDRSGYLGQFQRTLPASWPASEAGRPGTHGEPCAAELVGGRLSS